MVADACAAVRPLLERRVLDIAVEVPDDLGVVHGDGTQLERVVSNLAATREVHPRRRRIRVAATDDEHGVSLSVADTGCGIPLDEQDRLFTRFFRPRSRRSRRSRARFGLAITKAIVDGHGGGVDVESAPAAGTTVTVRLPRHPPAAGVA